MRILASRSLARLAPAVLVSIAAPAWAAWPNSPFTNLPVCTASGDQRDPTVVSDGAGGALITWADHRDGVSYDIYAQHVLASGTVDPGWPAGGRAVCTATADQYSPAITADGSGGAIVTWSDYRNGNGDIYAQHVLASGAMDPNWPVDGRALCTATNDQSSLAIAADGSGGAIVTWRDSRSGTKSDIYAQHVLASGAVDPSWPVDGCALCTAANSKYDPEITADGSGGAIVTWQDLRSGTTYDIYAQHVLASGAVDPSWPVDGQALCTAANNQYAPRIAPDGAGGAIVTWYDYRSGSSYDIYAQHVLAAGIVDGNWPTDGRALCVAVGSQSGPTIASDGLGGAIVAWSDLRSGVDSDIYAQHVLASGAVDPNWPVDGLGLCVFTGYQDVPDIVSDGAGGAIVTWEDERSGSSWDIYAQHALPSGAVDPAWPVNGRALCEASGDQLSLMSVSDGAGGAIVTWPDPRSGTGVNDIYAQRVARYGYLGTPEAVITAVSDVPNDQGGVVKLSWNASYLEADPYDLVTYYNVFRSVPPNLMTSLRASGARVIFASDPEASGFSRPGDLLATINGTTTYYWEFVTTVTSYALPGYSVLAPTAEDSTAAGAPLTAFMVQARTAGTQHWESLPTSGYSVDNLAPLTPAPFTGTYAGGTTYLHWDPNKESDLAGYRLYRGTTAGFVPGPANLVVAKADTGYADPAGSPCYYKLTAVDVHGNESPVATLTPSGTTAVGDGALPRELALAAPAPNPASGATTLRFALPEASPVRLAIYDAAGRLVRELAGGTRDAGGYAVTWDLRDSGGRTASAGLYFARLEAGGRMLVRRVAVTR